MSINKRPGGPYVEPVAVSGTATAAGPRGQYTLAAGTYVFLLGGVGSPVHSVQMHWDVAIAITSATIEDCNAAADEVADDSIADDGWADENPTTAFVATKGAGATPTNGVVAVVAGSIGNAMWHIGNSGAARTRLTVVVGTQGKLRVSAHGKA